MTDERIPRVSIGLAVYNGDQYLEQALDSILAQSYRDFELIISDNASNDRTQAICEAYAARDPRIRYYRNATNIGGANNENLTFRLARGEYFRWAAHDDVCAATLLEVCVEILDRFPQVVLCYTQVATINEMGRVIGTTSRANASSARPFVRFARLASSHDFLEETYGLMRSEVLRRTQLQKNYTASDRTLMAELSLYGPFHEVPQPLFYKRFHSGNIYLDLRARMAWFNPIYQGQIVFPFWMQFFDYLNTIHRVRLPAREKLGCYLYMGLWLVLFGKNLAKDLLVAGQMLLHKPTWRYRRHADLINWS